MLINRPGHIYFLEHVGGPGTTQVVFQDRESPEPQEGVTTQEVIRMLIDRTNYCDSCLPHAVNKLIVQKFREIIALHEARALIRKVEKGELEIEKVQVNGDGHLSLTHRIKDLENETPSTPSTNDWTAGDRRPIFTSLKGGAALD